ncbi:Thioredoxin domain-containing protein 17 [Trebouxia sp. C0009 RCD-2024]
MTVAGVEFECSVVEYPSFIANLPTLQEPHYVLYTADMDDATQQPWCPDCQQADPIIEEVIKESGGTLLKVKVGDKASWKSQDHPFRQDPQLHLTSIPTLMHWKADSTCPGKRLDCQLESVHSASDIKQAIVEFTVKAKEQDA